MNQELLRDGVGTGRVLLKPPLVLLAAVRCHPATVVSPMTAVGNLTCPVWPLVVELAALPAPALGQVLRQHLSQHDIRAALS
jgi:hypothetical protein